MFRVSDMMGDGWRDVVDGFDVVDSAEGHAGSHSTPGTARLVFEQLPDSTTRGGVGGNNVYSFGSVAQWNTALDKETIGVRWGAENV